MNTSTRAFIGLVTIAAATLLLSYMPFSALRPLTTEDLWGLFWIVLIAWLSEAVAFYFGTGHKVTASIAFLPFLAAIVLFPAPAAVAAVGITVLLSNIYPGRRPATKAAFNVSQSVLAAGLGASAYAWAGATWGVQLIAFFALVVVFVSVNVGLTSVAVALLRRDNLATVLKEVVGSRGANIGFDVLASPVALLLVFGYHEMHVWGLIFVVSPILLIRSSYASRLKLQQANHDLLTVLVKTIETRDPYTSGHSVRVATLAKAIAQDLHLRAPRVDAIFHAALLHDIGKIDPAYSVVIAKPHDLTADERALIQTHAQHGAKLLEELSTMPAAVIAAVRHHHEKWDGTGYPDGLKGNEIPLPARIIMLCDAIDAMLSDRPYRRALSVDVVRTELTKCSGMQFDPDIVRVVIEKNTIARATGLVEQGRAAAAATDAQPRPHFIALPA